MLPFAQWFLQQAQVHSSYPLALGQPCWYKFPEEIRITRTVIQSYGSLFLGMSLGPTRFSCGWWGETGPGSHPFMSYVWITSRQTLHQSLTNPECSYQHLFVTTHPCSCTTFLRLPGPSKLDPWQVTSPSRPLAGSGSAFALTQRYASAQAETVPQVQPKESANLQQVAREDSIVVDGLYKVRMIFLYV